MFHYQSFVVNQVGKPLSGATVTVNVAGGAAATIYSDDGVTTKGNPITTDATGYYDFYVADGKYDIVISGTGITTRTLASVDIFDIVGKVSGADQTWKVGAMLLGSVLGFSSASDASVAADSAISRIGSAAFAFGNGSAGDASGSLRAAIYQLSTDTGISRVSAAAVAVGNGTAGNATGIVLCASIKQGTAGSPFTISDNNGVSHIFISGTAPYTNTFVQGNGSGNVFLGSAAKTSVADTTGNITMSGATSGTTVLQASAVASGTLTFPAATDTLVGRATADNLINKNLQLAGSGNTITLLNEQGPAAAIVGTGGDVTVYTFTLLANQLTAGKGLRIYCAYLHSTGTGSVSYKVKIGATTLVTNTYAPANNTSIERTQVRIFNNAGVTNAQNWSEEHLLNLTGVAGGLSAGINAGTSTIDFTVSQTITITFNGAATEQITPKQFIVEAIQ